MTCKAKLEAYLRENGVAFELEQHPRAFTAQEVAASEHVPGERFAKVVMVVADGELAMLVLPAPYQVDLNRFAAARAASEVRIAQEREFAATFPDCDLGAMPPFGNLYGVPVYVDRSLARNETIVCQAGTHTETLSLRYADFKRLVQPETADFAHLWAVVGT
jgi:Ala-tRNA(Pro) deacylase